MKLQCLVQFEYLPQGELFLALETPEKFMIRINGVTVANTACSWWLDRAIGKVRLDNQLFVLGENRIELSCNYDDDSGLEAIYLLGDFGVRLDGIDGVVTKLPEYLHLGDIGEQGLPFFEGYLTYKWQGRGARLKIGRFEGALALIGGKSIWNAPEVLDGKFSSCSICITPRNAMGPFFFKEKRPAWCGPEQFKAHETSFRQLIAGGLYELQEGDKLLTIQ